MKNIYVLFYAHKVYQLVNYIHNIYTRVRSGVVTVPCTRTYNSLFSGPSHLAVRWSLAAYLVAPETGSEADSDEDNAHNAHQDPGDDAS